MVKRELTDVPDCAIIWTHGLSVCIRLINGLLNCLDLALCVEVVLFMGRFATVGGFFLLVRRVLHRGENALQKLLKVQ